MALGSCRVVRPRHRVAPTGRPASAGRPAKGGPSCKATISARKEPSHDRGERLTSVTFSVASMCTPSAGLDEISGPASKKAQPIRPRVPGTRPRSRDSWFPRLRTSRLWCTSAAVAEVNAGPDTELTAVESELQETDGADDVLRALIQAWWMSSNGARAPTTRRRGRWFISLHDLPTLLARSGEPPSEAVNRPAGCSFSRQDWLRRRVSNPRPGG